ncbi:tyrosine-type recombinase/integrase [Alkalibaculum sp. M08DMB]|uniref:Tyrosine-type recombinase/integrase n=1 Tax=Alkalibaculum sporogenes TaxID=2655001 RepID=A0A6A7K8Q3_9FIRM|nr:tyrosine-type recombinase/integrase [Alkalibaculum sporogenes]
MDKNTPDILNEYINTLIETGKIRPQTAKAYSYDIVLFLKYLKTRLFTINITHFDSIDIIDVDIQLLSRTSIVDIIAFMNYISNNRNNSEAAKARKLSSIRSFFNYLVNTKRYLDKNPCDNVDVPKKTNKLSQQLELDNALVLVNSIGGKFPLRDKSIILLFVYSGIRLIEIINIKLYDLDLENNHIVINQEGYDDKIVLLNNECKNIIYDYLNNERKNANCDYLFLSQRKSQISKRTIQHLIKSHVDKNPSIKNRISSQNLRNTIKRETDLLSVKIQSP